MARRLPRVARWLSLGAAALLIAITVRYTLARMPSFFGVDFYYIALNARDLATDAAHTSPDRLFYFPGAYRFWQLLLPRSGDLSAYQAVWAATLTANAALIALVLGRATGWPLLAAGAFVTYVSLALRLEGKLMTSEPIATLAWLAGCLSCWPLLRRGSLYPAAAALGAASGLTLFVKQQGGLLSLGALGLLTLARTHRLRALLAAGAVAGATATATFLGLMIAEGSGLDGVRIGLAAASRYQDADDLASNIAYAYNRHELLLVLVALSGLLWIATGPAARRRLPHGDALLTLLGIALCAFAASLWQFSKRHYAHYALLGLPAAVLAVGLALAVLLLRLREHRGWHRAGLLLLAALLLWLHLPQRLWALARSQPQSPPPPHAAYAPLCEHLRPGQPLLLVPSRQNALHWACGTHARGTRWGYAYGLHETLEGFLAELERPALTQVFIFKPSPHYELEYERQFFAGRDWTPLLRALAQRGFSITHSSAIGDLFTRGGPSGP